MNTITNKDVLFHFCNKENNENEKDNVPDEHISYFGWSKSINLNFGSYIRGYKLAAEATYQKFKNSNGQNEIQDTICFPLVFLYRHIVELYLKYAYIEIKKRSDKEIKELLRSSHDLEKIWTSLKPDILTLSERINLKVDIEAIEHYISSISHEDKMSFDYRYPITRDVKLIHDKSSYLDIKNLHDKMNLFFQYFDNIICYIKDQFLYLEYNSSFKKIFLRELETSREIITKYVELRKRLDLEEREIDKTKPWLSLSEIPLKGFEVKEEIYRFINILTENQKSLLILLYSTGRDIKLYKEKLAYDKEEHLKDIFRLIYSNISSEIALDSKKNEVKDSILYDYMFGRKYSVEFIFNTLNALGDNII